MHAVYDCTCINDRSAQQDRPQKYSKARNRPAYIPPKKLKPLRIIGCVSAIIEKQFATLKVSSFYKALDDSCI